MTLNMFKIHRGIEEKNCRAFGELLESSRLNSLLKLMLYFFFEIKNNVSSDLCF